MFKQEEKQGEFKKAETVIGPSIKVKGNFNGQGNIIVEGILEGSLKTSENVFIGDNAKITASIEAREARIGGEVTGDIKTKGGLKIVSSAKIIGNIECSQLSIENGATLNGKCSMLQEAHEKQKEVK